MGRRDRELFQNIEIETVAAEGKSLAHVNGKVIFVPFTVPGDIVDIQVKIKRKGYMEGFVTNMIKPSPDRIEPFCSHFGVCGGCKWQSLPYSTQLRFKQQQVTDQLTRIGHLKLPEITPILGSESEQYYRNKLEFTFSSKRWIESLTEAENLPAEQRTGLGFHIAGKMEDLSFRIGPRSFYQTNSQQAYRLYSIVRDFADLKGSETLYDLYTGTGTIALFLAHSVAKVVGIEYVAEAIEDAKINAAENKIQNCSFFAGDMRDMLSSEFIEQNGKPDVVVLDPPRAGIHPDVAKVLAEAAPEKIVYVSCNPATQARDIALLGDNYEIKRVQPVDMFPHTHHLENVVLLVKKG